MSDRAARISMLLGLAPLIVVGFWVGGIALDALGVDDTLRGATLGSTVLLCVAVPALWRSYIPRTPSSVICFCGLTLLLLGQVLVWRPMWRMGGCMDEDILRVGQSLASAGLWCSGCALSWWGLQLYRRGRRGTTTADVGVVQGWRKPMTPGVVRLTIGFGLLPFLPGLFWIVGTAMWHFLSVPQELTLAIAYEACALVTVATWVGVWYRGVAWTPGRRRGTIALAVGLLAVPWSPFLPDGPELWEAVRDTLPFLTLAAWFFSTALLWRTDAPTGYVDRSAAALDRAIGCPGCGYSLRGLHEVRCPECGWHSTVDVLMAHGLAAIHED